MRRHDHEHFTVKARAGPTSRVTILPILGDEVPLAECLLLLLVIASHPSTSDCIVFLVVNVVVVNVVVVNLIVNKMTMTKELTLRLGFRGQRGFGMYIAVPVKPTDTFRRVRKLVAEDFDKGDLVPVDVEYYFCIDGEYRLSKEQEERQRVWDVLDRSVSLRTKYPTTTLADGTSPSSTMMTTTDPTTMISTAAAPPTLFTTTTYFAPAERSSQRNRGTATTTTPTKTSPMVAWSFDSSSHVTVRKTNVTPRMTTRTTSEVLKTKVTTSRVGTPHTKTIVTPLATTTKTTSVLETTLGTRPRGSSPKRSASKQGYFRLVSSDDKSDEANHVVLLRGKSATTKSFLRRFPYAVGDKREKEYKDDKTVLTDWAVSSDNDDARTVVSTRTDWAVSSETSPSRQAKRHTASRRKERLWKGSPALSAAAKSLESQFETVKSNGKAHEKRPSQSLHSRCRFEI